MLCYVMCLINNQDIFELHRFTITENIAKSFRGLLFRLTLWAWKLHTESKEPHSGKGAHKGERAHRSKGAHRSILL